MSIYDLLKQFASFNLNQCDIDVINQEIGRNINWNDFLQSAEEHGLSPLIQQHIESNDIKVPKDIKLKFSALRVRHRHAYQTRCYALYEILHHFEHINLKAIVLKGMALAHLVYPFPELRPMRDIDLLIPQSQQKEAFNALLNLNYQITDKNLRQNHHHLPTLAKYIDGLNISIELHHDTISPDNIGSIQYESLLDNPMSFYFNEITAHALGPVDMLHHLCRHAWEPAEHTKIGTALDIVAYTDKYSEVIDWEKLKMEHPGVIICLQLLSVLIGYPSSLHPNFSLPNHPIKNIGVGIQPLSHLVKQKRWLAKLFNPSDWWLHGFYSVPLEHSLIYHKLVTHPCQVTRWLRNRIFSKKFSSI